MDVTTSSYHRKLHGRKKDVRQYDRKAYDSFFVQWKKRAGSRKYDRITIAVNQARNVVSLWTTGNNMPTRREVHG